MAGNNPDIDRPVSGTKRSKNIRVEVSHQFPHPPERVFEAWLDTEIARQFLFSASEEPLVRCEIDDREGGQFILTDRRPEGDVEHLGRYLEIDRPHKLVFSFGVPSISPDEDLVTIEVTPDDAGCELRLVTELKPEWADYVDQTRDGWSMILQSLERVLE